MPTSLNAELWPYPPPPGQKAPYPADRRDAIEVALTEAWAWLEGQGLVVRAPDSNGAHGWKILSRRAKRFQNESEFVQYAVARMFPKQALHSKIADKVWMAFMRGEFDVAVFQAMKAVEVTVREAAKIGGNLVGVPLMREAFAPEQGRLTAPDTDRGERVARMELFAGAIGSYKNPHSHKDVNLNDPIEAIEIILMANHLLRIVESRAETTTAQPTQSPR